MALKDQRTVLLAHISQYREYLNHNANLFKIHEGALLPFVHADMKKSFTEDYFKTIESRILPINILRRYIDKVSKAYVTAPIRTPSKARFKKTLKSYEDCFDINTNGSLADRWANLFKAFAWEIFVHEGKPRLRTIPFDRFMVWSADKVDPMNETAFIKFMGKSQVMKSGKLKDVEVYYAYTASEIDAFDSDGEDFRDDQIDALGSLNPYGVIPFVYGNRSLSELIPTQDSDILPMTKAIPVLASDLSGAILYTTTSLMWGVDVNVENAKLSPNAFLSLKSDPTSDKTPSIGVVKPQADIAEVINYIITMFALWLETKGVRAGSVGNVDAGNFASGISKMIDEMDTYEIRKENIAFFQKDEKELWEKVKVINNYWVQNDVLDPRLDISLLGDDFDVTVEFDQPAPSQTRMEVIAEEKEELTLGTTTLKRSIKRLHPEWTEEEVDEVLAARNIEVVVGDSEAKIPETEPEDDAQEA